MWSGSGLFCGSFNRAGNDVADIDELGAVVVLGDCGNVVLRDAATANKGKADRAVGHRGSESVHEFSGPNDVVGRIEITAPAVDDQLRVLLDEIVVEPVMVGGDQHAIEAGNVFGRQLNACEVEMAMVA